MLPAREQGEMKLRHAEGELNYATLKANIEAWLKHVDNGLQKMDLSSMEQRAAEGAASKEEIEEALLMLREAKGKGKKGKGKDRGRDGSSMGRYSLPFVLSNMAFTMLLALASSWAKTEK